MGGLNLNADDVNFLVLRYLQESGFRHSAFTFGYESHINKASINGADVPPGALVSFIQKGLQYLEFEANLNEEGLDVDADFASLTAHELLTKDVDELKALLRERRGASGGGREREPAKPRGAGKGEGGSSRHRGGGAAADVAANGDAEPMEEDAGPLNVPADSVTLLEGHASEVFVCAWSPAGPKLASGSGDSTARIWSVPENGGGGRKSLKGQTPQALVLKHPMNNPQGQDKNKDVTTLDWNADGSLLATGSYDGVARVWSAAGDLKQTLSKHKGAIFSLRWNPSGTLLLSGSVDQTAIVWDAATGEAKQQYALHEGSTQDVDWRDDTTFATCSTDKRIYVCAVGEAAPLKCFEGHANEVNAVKWSPDGALLASCSDDCTAKIWSLKSDAPVHNLSDHKKEVYTLKWSPTGRGSANPGRPALLATASFDATVKLWDVETGACVHNLARHTESVYSVAFSPSGEFLATGSFDHCLHIWSVRDGGLVRTYRGHAGIFEVSWNRDGTQVAAAFSNNRLVVFDLRSGKLL